MTQVIYTITNLVNDKFYVGSTINKKVRFREHRKQLRGNRHHCKHLQAAWNKYGEEKFVFKVVQEVPDGESLSAAEDAWLREHYGTSQCYNSGATAVAPWRGVPKEQHPAFGRPKTEEERASISKSLKEFYAEDIANHPRFGKAHSDETKELIRQKKLASPTRAWQGKKRSAETKQKISEAQRGVPKGPRTFTPEGLQRARENMKRNAKEQAPLDFSAVLAKFPDEVRHKYNFDAAVYTGALERITGCVCPKHGEFSQYAAQFRKGRGCPQCGAEERADSKRKQMKEYWATEEGRNAFINSRQKPIDS